MNDTASTTRPAPPATLAPPAPLAPSTTLIRPAAPDAQSTLSAATTPEFVGAIVLVLRELHAMVNAITDEVYTSPSSPQFMRATIGGHLRHSVDHLAALADGITAGVVSYDRRARGTAIESDRAAAANEIARLIDAITALAPADPALPLTIEVMATRAGAFQIVTSTLARELAFVFSHTVHHQATLRGIVVASGVTLPAHFGYANATIVHKHPQKEPGICVR